MSKLKQQHLSLKKKNSVWGAVKQCYLQGCWFGPLAPAAHMSELNPTLVLIHECCAVLLRYERKTYEQSEGLGVFTVSSCSHPQGEELQLCLVWNSLSHVGNQHFKVHQQISSSFLKFDLYPSHLTSSCLSAVLWGLFNPNIARQSLTSRTQGRRCRVCLFKTLTPGGWRGFVADRVRSSARRSACAALHIHPNRRPDQSRPERGEGAFSYLRVVCLFSSSLSSAEHLRNKWVCVCEVMLLSFVSRFLRGGAAAAAAAAAVAAADPAPVAGSYEWHQSFFWRGADFTRSN